MSLDLNLTIKIRLLRSIYYFQNLPMQFLNNLVAAVQDGEFVGARVNDAIRQPEPDRHLFNPFHRFHSPI